MKTRRHVPLHLRPRINVANYGMSTKVTRVPQVFKEPPPPGVNAVSWHGDIELRKSRLARGPYYPPGYFNMKGASEPNGPVRRGNNSPGFRPTRRNKNKAAFHATKLSDLRSKYGYVERPLSEL
jgi:hypothetical protein